MKISEMTNDQATDALLRISGPFAAIADDDELMTLMDEIKAMQTGGITVQKATAQMIPKFVTFALRKHKRDLYEIVGALTMKPAAEVGRMNIMETIQTVRASYDDVMASFFPQSGNARKSKGASLSAKSSATAGTDGTP
jgi:hypothetical protein